MAVMRFSALGDIAMTRPLIEQLKQKPLIITSALGKEVLSDIADDFLLLPSKKISDVLKLTHTIRNGGIQTLIDLQDSDRTRVMRLLANKRTAKQNLIVPAIVDRAITNLSATELFIASAEQAGLTNPYDYSPKKLNKDYIVVHPGSSQRWLSKRLPLEKWQEFGRLLEDRFALPIMITGDASERDYVQAIQKVLSGRSENLSGTLSIPALKTLLDQAYLTVSTDSGPMHLSAVLKTPTIGLFGATSWKYFAPFGPWSTAVYDPIYYQNRPPPQKNLLHCAGAYQHIKLEPALEKLNAFLQICTTS